MNSRGEPDWVTHAVWWQVYPLGFVGAPLTEEARAAGGHDAPAQHRMSRIVDWLDYAIELGASGIALGPIFASETHGYDTVDYFRIDPRLGDDADFDTLVAEAHRRGLRVLLDGVFNHVGRGFAPFQRATAGGPAAAEWGWFTAVGGDDGAAGDGGDGGAAGHGASTRFATFEGHDSLVALNHAEPAVADFVVEVMAHWLDRGADGWRLDAAYAVPAAFWADVLPRVRNGHPQAWFVGEVIHGDYSELVEQSTLDSLTQYELWKAIWSSIRDVNLFELDHALGRHNRYLDTFAPLTFVGNHDVTRLASAVDDPRHRAHALVVLLTTGGTPSIYYGDEQGLAGVKEERAGGDDAIRPEYPEGGPAALANGAATNGAATNGAAALAGAAAADGWTVYRLHEQLIALRRRHPWLHRAESAKLELTNTFYAYEVRDAAGASRLVVLLNLGDDASSLAVAGELWIVAAGAGAAGGAADARVDVVGGRTTVSVTPHGWAVLEG